jgi:hypothetical protein
MADKCRDIFRSASEKYPEYCGFEGPVLQLVSLAKQSAVGIGHKQIGDRSVWQAIDHFDIDCMDEATDTDNTLIKPTAAH